MKEFSPPADQPFNFNPRRDKNSYAAASGMKSWPDQWVCQNCAWVKPSKEPRKRVYCRKWQRGFSAQSDRMCYEEPLELKELREARAKTHP